MLVGASVLLNRFLPTAAATEIPTISPAIDTPLVSIPASLGPTGVLHFQDGSAIMDQASLVAQAMPAAPAGSHYEVWLVNGAERLSLGILSVDGSGRGTLIFDQPQDENLLASYHAVEITIKPNAASDPNGFERVAYSYTLPADGLVYLRGLMVSYPTTPKQIALIQGLATNAKLIEQAVNEMQGAYQNGDEAGTTEKAESVMSLLAGGQSQDHKDWNADGQVADAGDGYGLLLNGDNLGYIQAVYSNADYAVNSLGASRNMVVYGENVKICAENLARWAPELRERILTILNAASLSDMDQAVRDSVTLTAQMLNGIDLDENGKIESVSGECGSLTAYENAYHMADMPLLPVNALGSPAALTETATPSQTAPASNFIGSPTRQSVQATNSPAPATSRPRSTHKPKPTRRNPQNSNH